MSIILLSPFILFLFRFSATSNRSSCRLIFEVMNPGQLLNVFVICQFNCTLFRSRTGKIPCHHISVLPGSCGGLACLRYCKTSYIWECRAMAEGFFNILWDHQNATHVTLLLYFTASLYSFCSILLHHFIPLTLFYSFTLFLLLYSSFSILLSHSTIFRNFVITLMQT